jgi:hypothetical protein
MVDLVGDSYCFDKKYEFQSLSLQKKDFYLFIYLQLFMASCVGCRPEVGRWAGLKNELVKLKLYFHMSFYENP